jgi:acyl carrier protein
LGRLEAAAAGPRRRRLTVHSHCDKALTSAISRPWRRVGRLICAWLRRLTWSWRQRFELSQDSRNIMSSTFDIVAEVISETSEIPRDQITPDVHAIDDLGIDSLDFLDIVFALDKKFGIKIPLEAWTEDVNQGRAKVEDYFVLKNLCARIDELVAEKNA